MEHIAYLPEIILLLAAAVFIVALFKRLNLSPVLGYLVAGTIIGEHGLGYIDSEALKVFAELGIVFLLFAIGMELTVERLMAMRIHVFVFGSAQMVITTIVIALGCYYFFDLAVESSIIIGGSLGLSSTAVVLRVLDDNNAQSTQVGRLALANLILQDLAVVPLLILVPILAGDEKNISVIIGTTLIEAFLALMIIFFLGRMLVRPLFNLIAASKSNELFIAATLFVILGSAYLTESFGLSLALGAFIAGLLIAETQYQHKVEDNILPFKDLLMGVFFMAVGMTINIDAILDQLPLVLKLCALLFIIKAVIIIALSRAFRFPWGSSIHAGLLLFQGGEFAFILFNLAADQHHLIPHNIAEILLLVVTVTMALTPLFSSMGQWISAQIEAPTDQDIKNISDIEDISHHIVIIGFAKTGKVVATLLTRKKVTFLAVDSDTKNVKEGKELGMPAYHGDPTKVATLRRLKIDRAKAVIITVPDDVYLKKCIRAVRKRYSEIPIVVRAEDLRNAKTLKKLGATLIVPEKYEAGLQLAGALLNATGVTEFEISQIKNQFRKGNYEMAKDMMAVEEA